MIRLQSKVLFIFVLLVGVSLFFSGVLTVKNYFLENTSYLSDYNLTQSKLVSHAVQNQIESILAISKKIHQEIQSISWNSKKESSLYSKIDFEEIRSNRIKKGVIFRLNQTNQLRKLFSFGDFDESLQHVFSDFKWDVDKFLSERILIAKARSGMMLLGVLMKDESSDGTLFLFYIEPKVFDKNLTFFDSISLNKNNFNFYLVDSAGDLIAANEKNNTLPKPDFFEILKISSQEKNTFGVSQEVFKNHFALVAYDCNIISSHLLTVFSLDMGSLPKEVKDVAELKKICVFSVVSNDAIIAAAISFLSRSVLISVGLMLVLLSFVLFYIRKLNLEIYELILFSKNVLSKKTFNKINLALFLEEEIKWIAKAFNFMVEKVEEISFETKAFFLDSSFSEIIFVLKNILLPKDPIYFFRDQSVIKMSNESPESIQLAIHGELVRVGQYQGDYYFYEEFNGFLFIFIGQLVEKNHIALPLFSALRSVLLNDLHSLTAGQKPDLKQIAVHVNQLVFQYCFGKNFVQGSLFLVDPQTGAMEVVHHSKCLPYCVKLREPSALIRFKINSYLGLSEMISIEVENKQLELETLLFFYTEGFQKLFASVEKKANLNDFFSILQELYLKYDGEVSCITQGVINWFYETYGEIHKNFSYEFSILILVVSKEAQFVLKK